MMPTWAIICVVGIVINWLLLLREIRDLPEGAMGAGIAIVLAFVPYLFVLAWVADHFLENDSEP